jgi:hypothetical protein
MQEMTTPPMPKKKKSKMRQRISGRNGASAMFDTAEQTKMNEMMKKRKPRPAPKEPVDGMMMGGKVKGYKNGGKLKMVEKNGEQVPFYAADGEGKMKAGGKVKGYKEGKMVKKGTKKVRGSGCAQRGVRPAKMV